MTQARSRYPGLRPFDPEEQQYFFGREEEIKAVCRLLDLDSLTILHGPSGIGKSSLINAGILPVLRRLRSWEVPHHIVHIRFTNYDPELARLRRERQGQSGEVSGVTDPIDRFMVACLGEDHDWLEVIPMPTESLWLTAKKMLVDQRISPLRIVFILDQFEELFTYPEARVDEFARQLGELYHQVQPESVRKGLERYRIIEAAEHNQEKDEEMSVREASLLESIETPLDLKILISMRSDKLHFLERMKPFLPELMLNSYELRSFDREQAAAAIVRPASLAEGEFISPAFTVAEPVLDEVIGFLEDKLTRRIDPAQLQIVCQHIERRIIERDKKRQKEQA